MQQAIVYKARPEAVPRILELLRKEDLNPVALDNPDSTQRHYSAYNYLVRIAVPEDETHKARSILAEWEKSVKPTLDRISHRFSVRLAWVLLGLGIILSVPLFLGNWSLFTPIILVIYLSIFLLYVFIYIYNRRKTNPQDKTGNSINRKDLDSASSAE